MNLKEFKILYPGAKLGDMENLSSDNLNLLIDGNVLTLRKKDLSSKEALLLSAFFKEVQIESTNPWLHFLATGKDAPQRTNYRVIQFSTSHDFDEFKEILNGMIPNLLTIFSINNHNGVLVEKYSKDSFTPLEYQETFLALDSDFSSETRVYIGNIYHTDETKVEYFAKEQEIFSLFTEQAKLENRVQTISGMLITCELAPRVLSNPILKNIQEKLIKDPATVELIEALWKNQGSLSQTAKDLYLHRNSLQYKFKKFESEFGLSLRDMNDLLLCYLVLCA